MQDILSTCHQKAKPYSSTFISTSLGATEEGTLLSLILIRRFLLLLLSVISFLSSKRRRKPHLRSTNSALHFLRLHPPAMQRFPLKSSRPTRIRYASVDGASICNQNGLSNIVRIRSRELQHSGRMLYHQTAVRQAYERNFNSPPRFSNMFEESPLATYGYNNKTERESEPRQEERAKSALPPSLHRRTDGGLTQIERIDSPLLSSSCGRLLSCLSEKTFHRAFTLYPRPS